MAKPKKGYRFGGSPAHHNLMVRNLAISLIAHEKIKTTETRAKQVGPVIDRMVGLAKQGDLKSRRMALAELDNEAAVHKLFAEIAPRYEARRSGFTRAIKVGHRSGDAALVVQLEFV